MKKVILELSGIFIFLAGFIFLVNYFSGITGYVITNQVGQEFSSVAGIVFTIIGLMLFIAGRHIYSNKRLIVDEKKGIKKIKLAIVSKIINYEMFRKLVLESGYNLVETKDYTTIFSRNGKAIRDEIGYPFSISAERKNDRKLLIEILRRIVKDYNQV